MIPISAFVKKVLYRLLWAASMFNTIKRLQSKFFTLIYFFRTSTINRKKMYTDFSYTIFKKWIEIKWLKYAKISEDPSIKIFS